MKIFPAYLSDILGKKRDRVQETSANKRLIRKSRAAFQESNRLLKKMVQPDDYQYIGDFEEIADLLRVCAGMDRAQVEERLRGRTPEKWDGNADDPESRAIYSLRDGGEVWIEYAGGNSDASLRKVKKIEYHRDGKVADCDYLKRAKELMDLDLDSGEIARFSDTRGAFFGEGEALLELQYSSEEYHALKDKLQGRKHWKKLPIKLNSIEERLASCLSDFGLDFERPQSGLYLFYDRYREAASPYDYQKIVERDNISYSAVFLDDDTRRITYMELYD